MLTIEPMQAAQRDAFAEIWIPWLQASMKRTPELEDLVIMADPAAYYREEGGDAFLAVLDGQIVGAVAVKKLGPAGFEFCKHVVTEAARAHGTGRALVERCLAFAREHVMP